MISLKCLTSPGSHALFAEKVQEAMHVQLSPEYLGRGDVYAWVGEDDTILAGFALIRTPPFRVMTVVPEPCPDAWFRNQLARGLVSEINGLFVSQKAKGILSGSTVIRQTIRHFVKSGKTCVLFGYNKARTNLGKLWCRPLMNPVYLFDGVATPPGGTTALNTYVGYCRSDHFKRAFKLDGDEVIGEKE